MSAKEHDHLRRLRRGLAIQGVLVVLLVGAMIYYGYTLTAEPPVRHAWDETRDLRTPSGRLVGHWEMVSEVPQDVQQLYFGSVNAEGKGTTHIVLANGVSKEMEYRLTREVRGGQILEFVCLSGSNVVRDVKMTLPPSGQNAIYEFVYFDRPQKRPLRYKGPQISP
jgi:hypothetical protein